MCGHRDDVDRLSGKVHAGRFVASAEKVQLHGVLALVTGVCRSPEPDGVDVGDAQAQAVRYRSGRSDGQLQPQSLRGRLPIPGSIYA